MTSTTPQFRTHDCTTNAPSELEARISPQMAQEFLDVLSCVLRGYRDYQGPTRSVATGATLPAKDPRIVVALSDDGLGLRWGLAGSDEPPSYDHPECGHEIRAAMFPEAIASL